MNTENATKEYDLTGLRCPMPIVRLNKIMKELSPGETCVVTADDQAFCPDVEAWCNKTGNELVECETASSRFTATIRKQS